MIPGNTRSSEPGDGYVRNSRPRWRAGLRRLRTGLYAPTGGGLRGAAGSPPGFLSMLQSQGLFGEIGANSADPPRWLCSQVDSVTCPTFRERKRAKTQQEGWEGRTANPNRAFGSYKVTYESLGEG